MRTKILLITLFFLSLFYSTNAQFTTNRYLAGGSASYTYTSNPGQVGFYSNLQVGKVVKNNSVIGVIGSYASDNYNFTVTSPHKTRSYTAGIFYRKYTPLANKFYLFGELNAAYSFSRNIQENLSGGQYYNSNASGVAVSFIPGISYNVWKRLQMELSLPSLAVLSYSHISTIDSLLPSGVPSQKRNSYTAGINLTSDLIANFAIGFKFVLGK